MENILSRALSHHLITAEDIAHLLEQVASQKTTIQQSIDAWQPLVREAENEPKKEWVVATISFLNGVAVNERVDDVVSSYAEACDRCRIRNKSTSTSTSKIKRCRVVEKKDSIGCGEGSGRSCLQLLDIMHPPLPSLSSSSLTQSETEQVTIDWEDLLGHGNGYLSLRNKNVAYVDVPGVVECITLAGGLVSQLGLSQNTLGGGGTVSLMKELLHPITPSCFSNICALYLSNNNIEDKGAIAVADLIASRQLPIVKVGLNSNNITDVGACAIAKILKNNYNDIDGIQSASIIEVLGLSHNEITTFGACCVADAVKANTSIQRLFLNYNSKVGEEGGLALAAAARNHPSLLRLGVAFCSLSSGSGKALLNTLATTESMERICVSGNCFDEATEKLMQQMGRFNFSEIK